MKIGIDFDDVLFHFVPAFLLYHNRMHGTDFSKDDVWSYRFWEVFGIARDEALNRVFAFLGSPEAEALIPVEGSHKGIASLARDHELHIITARQEWLAEVTHGLLERHFPPVFSGVYFANHFSDDRSGLSKGVICDRLGIDVFIDDAPANVLESVRAGRKILLLDAPWNTFMDPIEHISRVRSWDEIVGAIATFDSERSER